MPRIEERDLAHEHDMKLLRREQLRAEDFSDSELLGDPDEYEEYWPDEPLLGPDEDIEF